MPKNIAQFTGMAVTAIVVFGTDLDVFYAVPLGIFAGMLATFFVALADWQVQTQSRSAVLARIRRN